MTRWEEGLTPREIGIRRDALREGRIDGWTMALGFVGILALAGLKLAGLV
jgi:hypothetical protein